MNREQRLFEPYIRDLNPKVIFEFGSYDLTDGMFYRKFWPEAEIYCFEPNPNLYKNIYKIAKENNIKIFSSAFTFQDGPIDFYRSVKLDSIPGPSGSLLKQTDSHIKSQEPFQTFPHLIKVMGRSIESFCEQHKIEEIDFMHMDVEGAVELVVNGFGDIRPKLIRAEVHGRDKLFKMLHRQLI